MTETQAGRPGAILVEDDPDVRRWLQLLLEARGFEVRAYATGSAALADSKVLGCRCVITDYRLSDTDGVALVQGLRTQGWDGAAVIITGYPSLELQRLAIAAGITEIVPKPFREHVLVEAVLRSLEEPRAHH